jgi:hypothetical protein
MQIILILVFIGIFLFTTFSTMYRLKLFSSDSKIVGRYVAIYVAIVGVLLGLVIFISLNKFVPLLSENGSKAVSIVTWFIITLLLYAMPNNNDETLMWFLWDGYPSDRRKLFSCMLLFLGLLFVPIALPEFGWMWVTVALILTVVLPILTIGLAYGLDYISENTRVDEN